MIETKRSSEKTVGSLLLKDHTERRGILEKKGKPTGAIRQKKKKKKKKKNEVFIVMVVVCVTKL